MGMLYHGSSEKFDEFSLDECGKNGTMYGFGVYLTSSESLAMRYTKSNGCLYTVQPDLKNELSLSKKTISRQKLSTIIDILHESCGLLYDFNDVDRYGESKVKQKAIQLLINSNTNDVDLMNELANITGDRESVAKAFFAVGEYTHTAKKAVVVVFDPERIQIEKRINIL